MMLVSSAGRLTGCEELKGFTLFCGAADGGWLIGWLDTLLTILSRFWADVVLTKTIDIAAVHTARQNIFFKFIKLLLLLVILYL
jgi:hypothetical protein